MDAAEDELDYGEYELGDQNFDPSSVQPSGPTEEATQDEDFEDLYDDVNIGYFEPSPEIPTKRELNGERFAGGYEEEPYSDVDGRAVASMNGIKQEALRSLPDFDHRGAQVSSPSLNAGNQKEEQENDAFPETQSKDKTIDELDHEQSRIARLAEVPSTKCSETTNYDNVDDQKGLSIQDMMKDKKYHEVAVPPGCTIVPLIVRNEGDSICNSSDHEALANTTFSHQERDVRENGPLFVEALSGTSHMGNNEGSILAGDISTGETSKMVGTINAKRSTNASVDKGRDFGGEGRPSQNGGNRESSSTGAYDHLTRHGGQSHSRTSDVNGGLMLFVGELHWWTTDAEIEAALSEFGIVKNFKFFEERASGKSKGYCQVEFYDHSAATACKDKMNGQSFHGRPCVVAFANSRTIAEMGTAQVNKAQEKLQAQQAQVQTRRMNDGGGSSRGGSLIQGGDSARSYGRMGAGGRGSHGQGVGGKGGYNGPVRGRATMGTKRGSGNSGGGGATYSQGLGSLIGSHPSGMVMPQGIMGQGYDPGYGPSMGRGSAGYGGYLLPGPTFSGMMPPFSNMGPGALAGVAPHVNPAFFSRTATSNGMGMIAGGGMDAPLAGLWGSASSNGWVAEEHDRRVREATYGDEMRGSNYGYSNDMGHEKSRPTGGRDKERDRVIDGAWSERRQRDDRDREREYHGERNGYRDQEERDWEQDKDDDWDREKLGRTRNRARFEEKQHPRAVEEEYGKKRRMGTGNKSF